MERSYFHRQGLPFRIFWAVKRAQETHDRSMSPTQWALMMLPFQWIRSHELFKRRIQPQVLMESCPLVEGLFARIINTFCRGKQTTPPPGLLASATPLPTRMSHRCN